MAKIIVRKHDSGGETPFDEQLWPVQVAIVVLAGYLLGVVFVFCDPNAVWWGNTYFWLAAIPTVAIAALFGIRYIENRAFRRAIQLAAVLSVIVHLTMLLLIFCANRWLAPPPAPLALKPQEQKKAEKKPVPRFDPQNIFVKEAIERPKQDFEKPVETATPDVAQTPPTPTRVEPRPEENQPTPPQPQPVVKPEVAVRPAVEKRTEPTQTAPRHSEQQSKLTRNVQKSEPQIATQAVATPSDARPTPQSSQIAGASGEVQKRVTTPTELKTPAPQTDPTTPSPQPTAQLAR